MAIFGFVQNPKQFCTGAVSCCLFSLSKNADGVGVGVAWVLAHAFKHTKNRSSCKWQSC